MLYLTSFHFLDLRFFITRTTEDDTRDQWLRPRWLIPGSGFNTVGRLGAAIPVPGRDAIGAVAKCGSVDGGLVLQTPGEESAKTIDPRAPLGDFRILSREIVADGLGQLRFDILLEKRLNGKALDADLTDMLGLELAVPLRKDIVALGDAPSMIAGIYETESVKTSTGFAGQDKAAQDLARNAAANTVVRAGDAPNIVAIDLHGEFDVTALAPVATSTGSTVTDLRLMTGDIAGLRTLIWHLRPSGNPPPQPANGDAFARDMAGSAFNLSCLVGRIHELSVFKRCVDQIKSVAQSDLVRDGIRKRNGQFEQGQFGGWDRGKVLAAAVRELWLKRGEADAILEQIGTFANNDRDAMGFKSNVTYVTNIASNYGDVRNYLSGGNIVSDIHNSIVNVDSILSNVSQGIGGVSNASDADKAELTNLVDQLKAALKTAPADAAEVVATQAGDLIEKAKAPAPNKTALQFAIDGLKRAAEIVKDSVPAVVTIATGIAKLIAKLHGLPI